MSKNEEQKDHRWETSRSVPTTENRVSRREERKEAAEARFAKNFCAIGSLRKAEASTVPHLRARK